MALRLDSEIQYLKGVGPKLGALFSRHGFKTVEDLFSFYPRAYEDRRAARNIGSLRADEVVSLKAQVVTVSSYNLGRSSRKIYDVLLRDSSGQIHCKYFRVPYKGYFERFRPHQEVRLVGKVTNYRGRLEFHHPDLKDVDPEEEEQGDQLIPLYTEIEGLSTVKLMKLIRLAFSQLSEEQWPEEKFPSWLMKEEGLLPRREALRKLHFPLPEESEKLFAMQADAQKRIIFEEFFWLELLLAAKKTGFKKEKTKVISGEGQAVQKILEKLPFSLTGAQMRALRDIQNDFAKGYAMHRLVQGDVGCGKTLVALLAAVTLAEVGQQSCLMVPTEILAEQHFKNAQKYLEGHGLKIAMLTGKTKQSERKAILEQLVQGEIQLLIGTHALIEDWVQYKELGLVIIDEQHRFGVEQRAQLKNKGVSPHFLVMTATPIPRTLAMTVYGDLDVSVIDEMPPGRSPIQTRAIYDSKRPQALQFLQDQIKKGRQAYIIYPLVDESEKIDLKNAMTEFENLRQQFPHLRLGLLHGKLKPAEKDEVMERFRRHELDVLVSTTVIEVGVDVPNANIILIEHAERFGLSQLHQLRGRVGRGEHKSFCILILGYAVSEESRQRVEFMEKTTDGFKIAEFDLELRGPGEFLGTRQSGLAGFKMANLVRDILILQRARDAAFKILQTDPKLNKPEHSFLRAELLRAHGPAALADIA